MSSFSPLATILKENKLTGPNFVEWKRNLDIVLTVEGHKYVLTDPYYGLGENPTPEELELDKKWKKDDTISKCYILASISPVL